MGCLRALLPKCIHGLGLIGLVLAGERFVLKTSFSKGKGSRLMAIVPTLLQFQAKAIGD